MEDGTYLYDEIANVAVIAPAVAAVMMLWWIETTMEGGMTDAGVTVEQLRRLLGMRDVIRKIMTGPNPGEEIVAWAMRGWKAEVINLDDFRAERERQRTAE
ncbi:hypothetical protein [Bradyrhizobium sp. DASA03007]|uniref:hypothetical protein n=1 Tax=unclassified Bradyrhizobium TaxID=2631580 RepID=UPI003F70417F